jgi:hypothetical protein
VKGPPVFPRSADEGGTAHAESRISRALTSATAKRLFNLSGPDFNEARRHTSFYSTYKSVELDGNYHRPQKMTALPGNTMNHLLIETDLAHLEQIINRVASSHGLSLSYWRNRVDSLLSMRLMPAQRKRIAHIEAVISMLEQAASSTSCR